MFTPSADLTTFLESLMFGDLLGWVSAVAGFAAMASKTDATVKKLLLIHTALYGVYFGLLHLPLAVLAQIIAFLRISLSLRTRSWLCVLVLCTLSVLAGLPALTKSTELPSFFPLIASFVLTVTLFRLSGPWFRVGLSTGSFLWLLHNVWIGSTPGVALEAGMLASNIVGWMRAGRTPSNPPHR